MGPCPAPVWNEEDLPSLTTYINDMVAFFGLTMKTSTSFSVSVSRIINKECGISCVSVIAALLTTQSNVTLALTRHARHARPSNGNVIPKLDWSLTEWNRPSFSVRSRAPFSSVETKVSRWQVLSSLFVFFMFVVCSIVQIYNKHAQTCLCLWPQSLFADIRVDSRSVAQMEMVPSEENQFVPTEVRGKKDRPFGGNLGSSTPHTTPNDGHNRSSALGLWSRG